MFKGQLIWTAMFAAACHSGGLNRAEAKEPVKIDRLVRELASPNKPALIEDGTASYPPGYDKKAQGRVRSAFHQLLDLGLPTFPHLLKHLDDKRYSVTEEDTIEGDWHNYSVGDLCYLVFSSHLQPYGDYYALGKGDPRERPRRPSYFEHCHLSDPVAAKKWWRARKDKTLVELQIEALKWVIAEEAKRPKDYSDRERKYLARALNDMRATGRPLAASWPFGK